LLASPFLDVLVGPHGIDRYLELVRPGLAVHEARADLVSVRHQTPGSVTLTLRPNHAWHGFRAGQFVLFGIEIDGIRRTRTFSPASSEHAGPHRELELTVTTRQGGVVSRYLKSRVRPGAVAHLGVATGSFTLPAVRPERLLLISGGSGITPVLAMLRTLCDEGHPGEIVFLHYARTAGHWLYRDEVETLARRHRNLRVLYRATREGGGHMTHEALLGLGAGVAGTCTAVCGPRPLVDSVAALWQSLGGAGQLLTETFTPGSPMTSGGHDGKWLEFRRSGARVKPGSGTLLELAEAAGLRPEFGCRMGVCGTCRCRKASGPVRNLLTGEVSHDLEEDIQLCVTAPAGDVILEL
jgi:ferredoxin-NADP reductase